MYFNEVLFGFYKILYTKSRGFLKGTKKAGLQQIEDSEQKTLDIIQALKAKDYPNVLKEDNISSVYKNKKSLKNKDYASLNPMTDLLFVGMAFKSWKNFN
jgi:hypothetical protein